MKKLIIYTLLILLPFLGLCQPVIDGSNDGVSIWGNAIGTNSNVGWNSADAKELYMTSDDTYVYFGVLATVRRWFNAALAVNTGATGSTTDPWGRNVVWNHTNGPDLQIRWDFNGNSGNGYAEIRKWNGSSWQLVALVSSEYASNINSAINDNDLQEDRWIEIRVPRSEFGSADKLDLQFAILGNNATNGNFNSIPADFQQTNWDQQTTLSNYISDNYITIRTSQSGNWSESATWIGGIPNAAHIVFLDHSVSLNQNATVASLTIANPNTLTINTGQFLTVSGTLTNSAGNAGLVVASGGSLIHSTESVPGTVQRSITAADWGVSDDGWHLISSPVASQAIEGSWTPSGGGNGYDFYAWSEATNIWLNQKVGANNITDFEVGKGYIAAYQQTATKEFTTGGLNSANVTVNSLTRTVGAYADADDAGFNLLGNPFPSAIRWHGTGVGQVNWSLVNISGVAQVWDRTGKDYAPVAADEVIPAMNGFMVQLTTGTTGSITIPAAAKVHDAQAFYKSSTTNGNAIKLVAREADNRSAKRSNIILDPQSSNEFDAYYDGRYLAGYGPRFYSLKSGNKLSSYSIPEFSDDMVIPFGFAKNAGELFVIELLEGIEGKTIYLTDLKLNTKTNLTQEGSYSFTSTQGDDPNRFLLHFGAVGVDETIPATAIAAYVSNNILYVLNAQGKVQVDVLDLAGRMVYSQSMQAEGLSSSPINLSAGVYVVRLNDGQTTRANKVIVQ